MYSNSVHCLPNYFFPCFAFLHFILSYDLYLTVLAVKPGVKSGVTPTNKEDEKNKTAFNKLIKFVGLTTNRYFTISKSHTKQYSRCWERLLWGYFLSRCITNYSDKWSDRSCEILQNYFSQLTNIATSHYCTSVRCDWKSWRKISFNVMRNVVELG